jgi:peptidoglycan hydrolase-like protein with peptidoglycan-binding domain
LSEPDIEKLYGTGEQWADWETPAEAMAKYGGEVPIDQSKAEPKAAEELAAEQRDGAYTRIFELGFAGPQAVEDFQAANGLDIDGVLGPDTMAAAMAPNVIKADGTRIFASLFGGDSLKGEGGPSSPVEDAAEPLDQRDRASRVDQSLAPKTTQGAMRSSPPISFAVRTRRPPIPLGGWSYADLLLRLPELIGGAGFDPEPTPPGIPSENDMRGPKSDTGAAPGFWSAGTTPDAHAAFGMADLSGAADFVFNGNRLIEKGAVGDQVRQIQRFLIAHGFTDDIGRPLVEDGRFTPFTRQALQKYQRRHSHLGADGKVGTATLQQMMDDNMRPVTQWFDETMGPAWAAEPTVANAVDTLHRRHEEQAAEGIVARP